MYTAKGRLDVDSLLKQYSPLVRRLAHQMIAKLPANVEVDDLIQVGMIGLNDALGRFDIAQGVQFETFATQRIRGAMLDELRKSDWTPRSVHRKVREMAEVVRQIEIETGADADDAEVMKRLGMSPEEYHAALADAASARLLSLTAPDEGEGAAALEVADPDGLGPAESIEQDGLREALIAAIGSLPEREQLVMSLYYEQELNLKEIGAVLGVTESRVCQIHGQAVVRLRARLAGWRDGGGDLESGGGKPKKTARPSSGAPRR